MLTTTASVDGRVTLGSHQRLIDRPNRERWGSMLVGDPFPGLPAHIDATVVLEGSGSFVDIDDPAPQWPAPTTPEHWPWQDHLPRTAPKWFVAADSRGRVDWTYTGDETTILHVLVCGSTPGGYLQRRRHPRRRLLRSGRPSVRPALGAGPPTPGPGSRPSDHRLRRHVERCRPATGPRRHRGRRHPAGSGRRVGHALDHGRAARAQRRVADWAWSLSTAGSPTAPCEVGTESSNRSERSSRLHPRVTVGSAYIGGQRPSLAAGRSS